MRKTSLKLHEIYTCEQMQNLRHDMGVSQEFFAALVGLKFTQLSNREHCRAPWSRAELLEAGANIDVFLHGLRNKCREIFIQLDVPIPEYNESQMKEVSDRLFVNKLFKSSGGAR